MGLRDVQRVPKFTPRVRQSSAPSGVAAAAKEGEGIGGTAAPSIRTLNERRRRPSRAAQLKSCPWCRLLRRSANRKDDMDKTRRTTTAKQLATSTRAGKGLARVGKGWQEARSGLSGGLEPCRRSRPVRDATPTITPTIFCSDRLAADAGPGRRRSQLPQIRPDALEAPDFVGIGEETGAPGRAERPSKWWGQVWVPCQLARPRPRWTT